MQMQPPGPSRMQRRSPGADPGPPPSLPARSISPALMNPQMAPRSSAASSRVGTGGSSRRRNTSSNPSVPLSQIEKSVTHLLVATKQLLETLTQWSRGEASDTQVSDVYVRLGYEFNMACRAFSAINVETADLGNVPELLRNILEATLSQEASHESLERYLPRIRDIIINLLHGLKKKQQKLRQKQARDRESGASGESGGPARTTSTSTTASANSGLTTLLNEGIENGYGMVRDGARSTRSTATGSPSRGFHPRRDLSRASVASEQSSISSGTMQNMPVVPPYPGDEMMPAKGNVSTSEWSNLDNFPPPPPPPKASQQSALAALQRGGDLERRASRRYSAYQISKHLGASAGGVPMLPSQMGPIPNRGRAEARESMRAMQAREHKQHECKLSTQSQTESAFDSSPVRVPSRVSEEAAESPAEAAAGGDSPANIPDEKYPHTSATLDGPPPDSLPVLGGQLPDDGRRTSKSTQARREETLRKMTVRVPTPEKQPDSFMLENSPLTAKELTLFLQYKSKVKKFVLQDGHSELSIGRLQLAFIEKFSWNTQQNGADLPDIYIQDPVSGVRHELEDLSDIKDRTVLVLNVEPLDEVKKHIDDGFGFIRKLVEDVRQNMAVQGAALQRVSERQQETAQDVARLAAVPPPVLAPPADLSPRSAAAAANSIMTRKPNSDQLVQVQKLRRDLAVLRQTYFSFQSDIQGSMSALRTKAKSVKMAAAKMAIPDWDGSSGHAYVRNGRKQMNADSDRLVTKVDDLQDLVEDLRKDVVVRGVRPLPRQLEVVTKDISDLTKELRKMGEYMKREKPIWTRIWEKELEDVCQGRDELRLMEDLLVDLQDDLEKASETFALVEQATKEQMRDAGVPAAPGGGGGGGGGYFGGVVLQSMRQFSSRGGGLLLNNADVDPSAAKEGVLGEVRALQPNHEDRLEAIERAEKLRQKELQSRGAANPLTREISSFVGEGRLKKSGGVEEVERARKAKEERIRREVWQRQNGIVHLEPEAAEDEEREETGEEDGEMDAGGKGEQDNLHGGVIERASE